MTFKNREEAAEYLAERLARYRGMNPLILAIPRGGAALARVLGDRLGGDVDMVLVTKLRAPRRYQPAIGSIDEHGNVFLNAGAHQGGIDMEYLEREKKEQLDVLERRRDLYSRARQPIQAAGRTVIVVDDGAVTGATMIAALRSVRARKPGRLIAAIAVAPIETIKHIRDYADIVVCLATPPSLQAVGECFERFDAVEDGDIIAMLMRKSFLSRGGSPTQVST